MGLAERVELEFESWDDPIIERSIFGVVDPHEIAREIANFCVEHVGAQPIDAMFYTTSVKVVAGLELSDGRRVVLKAFQRRWPSSFLSGIQKGAMSLFERGFPCPRPLTGPYSLGNGQATLEEFLPDQSADQL